MREWVMQGWQYTDKFWPFGQSAVRHEEATYVLGSLGQGLGRVSQVFARSASRFVVRSSVSNAQGRRNIYRGPTAHERYREGLRQGREESTKYRMSCILQVLIDTESVECFLT